eukprot:GHVT01020867.1.p1 GENE.GHVT01020867.1~~GHVT01020867.1.p1  ORF type:complete len:833 (-),score=189.41 GHVT01020867.1:3273-5771(-)
MGVGPSGLGAEPAAPGRAGDFHCREIRRREQTAPTAARRPALRTTPAAPSAEQLPLELERAPNPKTPVPLAAAAEPTEPVDAPPAETPQPSASVAQSRPPSSGLGPNAVASAQPLRPPSPQAPPRRPNAASRSSSRRSRRTPLETNVAPRQEHSPPVRQPGGEKIVWNGPLPPVANRPRPEEDPGRPAPSRPAGSLVDTSLLAAESSADVSKTLAFSQPTAAAADPSVQADSGRQLRQPSPTAHGWANHTGVAPCESAPAPQPIKRPAEANRGNSTLKPALGPYRGPPTAAPLTPAGLPPTSFGHQAYHGNPASYSAEAGRRHSGREGPGLVLRDGGSASGDYYAAGTEWTGRPRYILSQAAKPQLQTPSFRPRIHEGPAQAAGGSHHPLMHRQQRLDGCGGSPYDVCQVGTTGRANFAWGPSAETAESSNFSSAGNAFAEAYAAYPGRGAPDVEPMASPNLQSYYYPRYYYTPTGADTMSASDPYYYYCYAPAPARQTAAWRPQAPPRYQQPEPRDVATGAVLGSRSLPPLVAVLPPDDGWGDHSPLVVGPIPSMHTPSAAAVAMPPRTQGGLPAQRCPSAARAYYLEGPPQYYGQSEHAGEHYMGPVPHCRRRVGPNAVALLPPDHQAPQASQLPAVCQVSPGTADGPCEEPPRGASSLEPRGSTPPRRDRRNLTRRPSPLSTAPPPPRRLAVNECSGAQPLQGYTRVRPDLSHEARRDPAQLEQIAEDFLAVVAGGTPLRREQRAATASESRQVFHLKTSTGRLREATRDGTQGEENQRSARAASANSSKPQAAFSNSSWLAGETNEVPKQRARRRFSQCGVWIVLFDA